MRLKQLLKGLSYTLVQGDLNAEAQRLLKRSFIRTSLYVVWKEYPSTQIINRARIAFKKHGTRI